MELVFVLLYIIWFISIFFIPTMICGYNYPELFALMGDSDLDIVSKFLKDLHITEETVKQTATKYVFLSIFISIAILAVIVALQKVYNYYRDKINRKIKLEKQEIKLKQLEIEKLTIPTNGITDNTTFISKNDEENINQDDGTKTNNT